MKRWKVRKVRVYDRDRRTWTHHFAWTLFYDGKVVARYLHWQRCIDHIQSFYNKFGAAK